jgi:hypothetical protein
LLAIHCSHGVTFCAPFHACWFDQRPSSFSSVQLLLYRAQLLLYRAGRERRRRPPW